MWAIMALSIGNHANGQISVIVQDSLQDPIAGAVVELDQQRSITDINGACFFPESGQALSVRLLGYEHYMLRLDENEATSPVVIQLRPVVFSLERVELIASWIQEGEPFSHSVVDRKELASRNLGMDVPYLLQYTPGAVVTSDAGTGIGYTGYRLRGSDATRINVTIDGIPLNDSESQGVFWVDLPDFASSVESVQVQRGVGPSTNGAGAFGGTISLKTKGIVPEPYLKLDGSTGSFNTRRAALSFGTGRVGRYITFDGRASMLSSDGYIDRGSADLRSLFGSAKYMRKKTAVSLNVFTGYERTYQAWNGVPAQWAEDEDLRNSNTAGLRSDGSFHPDEVDDYRQTHVHLKWGQDFENNVSGRIALHYTRGKGYFEQYRISDPLSSYGIASLMIDDVLIEESDLIRRRWLDNHFGGAIFSVEGNSSKPLTWHLGGGFNSYWGDHFGQVIWSRFAGDSELGEEYYRNDAVKTDGNLYARINAVKGDFRAFADMQYRVVDYRFEGFDADLNIADQEVNMGFFNPKLGVTWQRANVEVYYSLAGAHREPNRNDYTNSSPESRPVPEQLWDHELGIRGRGESHTWSINGYFMDYSDQLVLTGELNDVGEAIRQNVDKSHRMGVEVAAQVQLSPVLTLLGNGTLSTNKIKRFAEFIDDWDTGEQFEVIHENSNIAFSPASVLYGGVQWNLINQESKQFQVFWHHKYVGSQFLDNTNNPESSLDPYYFSDLELRLGLATGWCKQVDFRLQLRNIFNSRYASNGWIYRYRSNGYDGRPDDPHTQLQSDGLYNLTGLYPQALRNFLLGVVVQL